MRLAMDEAEREGREAVDENIMDSPGIDTMSDDGTIDGNDHLMDPLQFARHSIPSYATTPRPRPRPRSMHELPSSSSFHVDLPLMSSAQMQQVGTWTPSGPVTPEMRTPFGPPPHLNLISSNPMMPEMDFEPRASGPGVFGGPTPRPYENPTRSTSQTPSRRHTLADAGDGYIPAIRASPYADSSSRPFEIFDEQRRFIPPGPRWPPQVNLQPGTSHLWSLGMRSASDIRQTYLRPEQDYSAFDANHEAIMATIPAASRGSSRHASRSNSPHPGRLSSRSRLSNLLSGIRTYGATPFTYAEAAARSLRGSRSRDRSRLEEEERREAMLRAMAEADSAQQLRPDLQRGDIDRTIELPLLHHEMNERPPVTPYTPIEPTHGGYGTPGTPPIDENQDVTMTQ